MHLENHMETGRNCSDSQRRQCGGGLFRRHQDTASRHDHDIPGERTAGNCTGCRTRRCRRRLCLGKRRAGKGHQSEYSAELRDLLRMEGYTVEVTRDSDKSIHDDGVEGIANQKSSDMDNRLALFNQYDNAVCISVHQNQFTDPAYSGAQMFYSDNVKRSGTLAQCLQNAFVTQLQPDNAGRSSSAARSCISAISAKIPRSWWNAAFCPIRTRRRCWNRRSISRKWRLRFFPGCSSIWRKSRKYVESTAACDVSVNKQNPVPPRFTQRTRMRRGYFRACSTSFSARFFGRFCR